jgi:hypothetical protein
MLFSLLQGAMWPNVRVVPSFASRLETLLTHSRCDLPVFWSYDQGMDSALTSGQGVGNATHYLLLETPYYAPRRPNKAGSYSNVMRHNGYLSLGFDGLQGRAVQWKNMPPDRYDHTRTDLIISLFRFACFLKSF